MNRTLYFYEKHGDSLKVSEFIKILETVDKNIIIRFYNDELDELENLQTNEHVILKNWGVAFSLCGNVKEIKVKELIASLKSLPHQNAKMLYYSYVDECYVQFSKIELCEDILDIF